MLLIISRTSLCILVFSASAVLMATGQQITRTILQPGSITGTVTDVNDDIVPGANVTLQNLLTGASDRRCRATTDHTLSAI